MKGEIFDNIGFAVMAISGIGGLIYGGLLAGVLSLVLSLFTAFIFFGIGAILHGQARIEARLTLLDGKLEEKAKDEKA